MRLALATILIATVPTLAAAQSKRPAIEVGSLPTIGLPLPQIGLPLPAIGLPPIDKASRAGGRRSPPQNQHRRDGTKGVRARSTVVYVVPGYGWDYWPAAPIAAVPEGYDGASPSQEPTPLTGALQLDVLPHGIVQLYVDGYYAGTPDDSNGELVLAAGPHRIDIRAPGYETVTLDVRIEPGRTITYRSALVRVEAKPAPEPPLQSDKVKPLPRKPVYVIPGCYLGNVPPKDAGLPATCDQSRVKVLEP